MFNRNKVKKKVKAETPSAISRHDSASIPSFQCDKG